MSPTSSLASEPVSPSAPVVSSQRLSAADCGQFQITGFELPSDQEHRLRTMGLYEGQSLEVLRRSDPVIFKVAGARMALARAIAGGVHVASANGG
ncbi:FeoA family protein [Roseimaritima sediminicola]|uniref:FeoA family protein n=1 Tax=Roseimaritima sediminicola TaxID=2662066 RepID=UPI00138687B4|nr:FeoA family protein [Roseimaritima sediminicola]